MGELQRQQQHLLYLVCFLWIGFPCCTGTTRAHSVKSARIRVDNKNGFPFDELSVRAPLFGLYKTVFLIKPKLAVSAFDKDADVDVIGHPILNLVYYMLAEIVPSALVLFILRKLPLRRVSDQYHYQPLS